MKFSERTKSVVAAMQTNNGRNRIQREFVIFAIGMIVGHKFSYFWHWGNSIVPCQKEELVDNSIEQLKNEPCKIFFESYDGSEYTTEVTIGSKCLVESKWMKVMQHSIQMKTDNSVIDDWLWIDYHDRINVLVESDDGFIIFRQTKYALEGRNSLAVIGGIVEPGETPEETVRREVQEELSGTVCHSYEHLGRFRTDVNRGMGWIHSFVASGCHSDRGRRSLNDAIGGADTEDQRKILMDIHQLREAAAKGLFLEVQWSNTISLALLKYSFRQ